MDWDQWFYTPGLPPKPTFDTSLVDVVYELANKWKRFDELSFSPKASDLDGLVANQIVVFLEQVLLFEKPLTTEQSRLMGQVYNFAQSQNIEVSHLYFQMGLRARDETVVEPATKLLGEIGRMKFVRPLYVPIAFMSRNSRYTDWFSRYRSLEKYNRDIAVETFRKHRDFYHPICRGMLEKDLFGKKDP